MLHNVGQIVLRACTIASLLFASAVFALPSDSEQPIRIAAEHATLDQKQGLTTYSGNVQFSQGSMIIKADQVVAYFDAETQKIQKVTATGSPATYELQPTAEKGSMAIKAVEVTAIFDSATQKILSVNAKGGPALYQQQPSLDKGVISARARSITFTPATQQLSLDEEASLEQDGASMTGNQIIYDLKQEVMQAGGDMNSSQNRIEIVIPPQAIP